MKVLLVIPPSPQKRKIVRWIDCCQETKASYLWQPNDFIIISSLLKPEDILAFVDGTADSLSEKEFFEKIKQLEADIVFTAVSTICWKSDIYYFQKVKALFPNVAIYVIGDVIMDKHYRSLILGQTNGLISNPYLLDLQKMAKINQQPCGSLVGVCREPEVEPFSRDKKITFIPESNPPRHEYFIKRGYGFPFAKHFKFTQVTTVVGCPFSCSYCIDSKIPPVVRNFESVIKELDYLKNLGIKELYFADKVFGYPEKNVIPILEAMVQRFNFSWCCYFSPQLYNSRLLELMNQAGCHTIVIGVETYKASTLKQYKREVKQKQIEDLIAHANRLKMSICADFILGLEDETETDIVNTIKYALSLPIDFASFNIVAPFVGSSIREKAIASGYDVKDLEGFDSVGRIGNLGNKYVTAKRLRQLRTKAVRNFYFRPTYLWRRLRKTSSLEHLHIQLNNMMALLGKS